MSKKKTKTESVLPTLKELLIGGRLGICTEDADANRHLTCAGLKKDVVIHLNLASAEMPGDAEEWEETRSKLGKGSVVCPACEGEAEGCPLCSSRGIVTREQWDKWYYSTKDCRDYKAGCEKTCKKLMCVRDLSRMPMSEMYLKVEINGKSAGDSVYGFRGLERAAKNPVALERFFWMVVASIGAINGLEEIGDADD